MSIALQLAATTQQPSGRTDHMSKQAQRLRRIGESRATVRANLNARDQRNETIRYNVRNGGAR